MSCDCKDGNGLLLDKCLGICRSAVENGITDILREFRRNLNTIEVDVRYQFENFFLEAFKKGFEMAREIYECTE